MMRRSTIAAGLALLLAAIPAEGARFGTRAAYGGGVTAPALPAIALPLPALPRPAGSKLMVVGDSLSNFNGGAVTTGANGYAFGRPSGPVEAVWASDPRFNFDSWYDPADPWIGATGIGSRGINGANQGIAGDHLDWCNQKFGGGILNRTRYGLARGPAVVWLNAGTNTISTGDTCNAAIPATAGYVIERLDATIAQFTTRGVWVILSTLYPRGDWPSGDPRHETLRTVNAWIRTQAGRSGIVGIMDAYAALVSPSDPDGVDPRWFQPDLVHPGVAGGWLIGNTYLRPLIEAAIAPGATFDGNPATANLLPAGSALLNGGTAGTKVGTVTGVVATGLTATLNRDASTAVATIEDAGGYRRQAFTLVPAGAGASYGQLDLSFPSLATAALPAGGSWMRGYIHVETPDAVSIGHVRMIFECRSSSEPTMMVTANFEPSSTFTISAPGRGGFWIATKPFRLPANPTLVLPRLSAFWPSSGYAPGTQMTLKVDRAILRASPAPQAAWNLP